MRNVSSGKKISLWLFALLISILFKIIPAIPNFNPQIVLVLYLGTVSSGSLLCGGVIILSVFSDLVSAHFFGYPVFGSWTCFTYSAYCVIGLSACFTKISSKRVYFFLAALTASLSFWLWTNLGTWLLSGMYQHTLRDFIRCYLMAIPFLKPSLLAALFWSGVLFFIGKSIPFSDQINNSRVRIIFPANKGASAK